MFQALKLMFKALELIFTGLEHIFQSFEYTISFGGKTKTTSKKQNGSLTERTKKQ